MVEKRIGLYIGVKSVSVVVLSGQKLDSQATSEFSTLEEEAKVETLSEDIRWEALINKTLRDAQAEGREISVSLADKNFIFRSFEMPAMKKKELDSSLIYEVEKYVPFKVDELMWDYNSIAFPKEKKLNVLFLGIREVDLKRIQAILKRLAFSIVTIEPSALSLAKVLLAQNKFSRLKNFALLDFTAYEGYLTMFHQSLPVFNQCLTISSKEGIFDLEKFVDSIRVAFQYFRREFRYYGLEKCILVGTSSKDTLISHLREELQIDVEMVTPYDLTTNMNVTVEHLKALGAAVPSTAYRFKPVFKKAVQFVPPEVKVEAKKEAPALNLILVFSLLGASILALVLFATYRDGEIKNQKNKLSIQERGLQLPAPLKDKSIEDIDRFITNKENEVNYLTTTIASFKSCSSLLSRISIVFPTEMWLESLELRQEYDRYKMSLRGNIFLGDGYKERAFIDDLLSRLNSDRIIKSIFSMAKIDSLERRDIQGVTITGFAIRLE